MLSNKGSAKSSFIFTFLFIFIICGLYCFFILYSGKSNYLGNKGNYINNYEEEFKIATQKYVNDYYADLGNGEKLLVKLSTLENFNYINIPDCEGYSIIIKEQNLNINSYLKCSNYLTDGYSSEYE